MHLSTNDNHNQTNTATTVNIQTAITLWEAKDWQTYKATRDALLTLIRSGRGDEVGIEQMQFIYFINTHLRPRLPGLKADSILFKMDLPPTRPRGDKAWEIATEGAFWHEVL